VSITERNPALER